jgi:hypothetical protein
MQREREEMWRERKRGWWEGDEKGERGLLQLALYRRV